MLNLIFIMALSFAAHATDEMQTQTVKDGAPTSPVLAPPKEGPQKPPAVALDPNLRAKIRSKAPFWIDDKAHGAAIRLNKDGTFSSEAQGGGAIAGQWKAIKGGEVEIVWSDGGEKYKYKVTTPKGGLNINGRPLKKGRINLN
jgi:hypothetical protein